MKTKKKTITDPDELPLNWRYVLRDPCRNYSEPFRENELCRHQVLKLSAKRVVVSRQSMGVGMDDQHPFHLSRSALEEGGDQWRRHRSFMSLDSYERQFPVKGFVVSNKVSRIRLHINHALDIPDLRVRDVISPHRDDEVFMFAEVRPGRIEIGWHERRDRFEVSMDDDGAPYSTDPDGHYALLRPARNPMHPPLSVDSVEQAEAVIPLFLLTADCVTGDADAAILADWLDDHGFALAVEPARQLARSTGLLHRIQDLWRFTHLRSGESFASESSDPGEGSEPAPLHCHVCNSTFTPVRFKWMVYAFEFMTPRLNTVNVCDDCVREIKPGLIHQRDLRIGQFANFSLPET